MNCCYLVVVVSLIIRFLLVVVASLMHLIQMNFRQVVVEDLL